jgi:hypothetical protein
MTASVLTQVKSLGKGGTKPLHAPHAPAQVCSIGSKQEVIVVVHQNVGKKVYFEPLRHLTGGG